MTRLIAGCAVLWVALAACSSGGSKCTPGQQIACACVGATTGAQACKDDGSGYGACLGCSGTGGGGGGTAGGSGGGGGSAGGMGGGSAGGSGGGTADAGVPNPALVLVHGSPDFPPFRLCLGTGQAANGSDTSVAPIPALPHRKVGSQTFPATFPGEGDPLARISNFDMVVITPFVIDATKITAEIDSPAEKTCDVLIGAAGVGGTVASTDYFRLPSLPKGTFPKRRTQLLVLEGCLPGLALAAGAARCGPTYATATGNLSLQVFTLSQQATDPGALGTQVAHAAPGWDGIYSGSSGEAVAQNIQFTDSAGISLGGSLALGLHAGGLDPTTPAPYPLVGLDATNRFRVQTVKPDGGLVATLALSLSTIADLTRLDAGSMPFFHKGMNVTFLLLGDPSAQQLTLTDGGANPAWGGRGVHVLAFPDDVAPNPVF